MVVFSNGMLPWGVTLLRGMLSQGICSRKILFQKGHFGEILFRRMIYPCLILLGRHYRRIILLVTLLLAFLSFPTLFAQIDESVIFNENTSAEQLEFWSELEPQNLIVASNLMGINNSEESSKIESRFLNRLLPFNHCSNAQLMRLGNLTIQQIDTIQAHKNRYGDFLSAVELLQCGIPHSKIVLISKHFHFESQVQIHELFRKENNPSASTKIQLIAGSALDNGSYLIPSTMIPPSRNSINPSDSTVWLGVDSINQNTLPQTQYLKLKVTLNPRLTLGLAIQNDPNEKWGDLLNSYLRYQAKNGSHQLLKTFILGKYVLMQNQGHVSTAPFPVGRLFAMESWQYSLQSIQGVGGFNEDVGFWGMAMQYEIFRTQHFQLNGITHAGFRKLDAVIRDSMSYFERQQWGGIHVSTTEISRQNAVFQSVAFQSLGFNSKSFSSNVSMGLYRHSIPRKVQNQLKNHEINVEWAATAQLLGGKWNGSLAWDGSYFSKYLAAYYLWNSDIQWGWKWEHLPENFYSIELSPYTYYNRGKAILTAGLDWKLNSTWLLKIRQTTQESSYWGMALDGKIQRKTTTQIRWEPQNHRIKWGVAHALSRWHEFRYQLQCSDSFSSTPRFYSSCVWKFKSPWADFLLQFSQFQTQDELYYASIPSITQNWTSRVFSGSGQFISAHVKAKLDRHFHVLIQYDWLKKKIVEPLNSQQFPRIFVQLNIQ